jgi:hypothetical protein
MKLDTIRNKLAQFKQQWLKHVSRMKTLDTHNNSLTIGLSEDEDTEDR